MIYSLIQKVFTADIYIYVSVTLCIVQHVFKMCFEPSSRNMYTWIHCIVKSLEVANAFFHLLPSQLASDFPLQDDHLQTCISVG